MAPVFEATFIHGLLFNSPLRGVNFLNLFLFLFLEAIHIPVKNFWFPVGSQLPFHRGRC
jgi:hypothetical protein